MFRLGHVQLFPQFEGFHLWHFYYLAMSCCAAANYFDFVVTIIAIANMDFVSFEFNITTPLAALRMYVHGVATVFCHV